MIHDIEIEVEHEITRITAKAIHKTYTAQHLEIVLVMTKVLLLHTTLVHDLTPIKETRDLIALLIDPHTNHLIDVTPVTDIDQAQFLEIKTKRF